MLSFVKAFAFLALLSVVFAFDPSTYPNKIVFNNDYTFYWKLNGQKVQFGIAVATTGWVSIGISEKTAGTMRGGDMAVITYAGNKPVITDHYAMEFDYPSVDSCQDWVLLSHAIKSGVTWAEVERLMDTKDNQDRIVEPGQMMIIYAFGTNNQLTLQYHDGRRGIYAVEFMRSSIDQPMPTEPDIKTVTNLVGDFHVPVRTTTYACKAHKIPIERIEGDRHIVRVEPIMDPRTNGITHHMLVHQCVLNSPISWAALYLAKTLQCVSPIGMPFSGCNTLLYGWAMGMSALNTPPDAGARMGYGPGTFQYIVTEMHYDNPNAVAGLVDNSGYKMFYTARMRKYDVATLTSGDPYISFPSIPPGVKSFGLEATCPSQCTNEWKDDLVVFTSGLHMHVTGSQMWTTVYRNDKYVGTIARTDFFAFDQQHTNYVNFTIKRGDRLNTHCVFDTRGRIRTTNFGYASFSEMCMDFLGYYPRQEHGLSGADFSYCGYFGWFGPRWTLCGSNVGFMTGTSIMMVKNPIASDLEETRDITYGIAPTQCLARE